MRHLFRRLPGWLLLMYAAFFGFMAWAAHLDSRELGYPVAFLILGAASSLATVGAVVLFALRVRSPQIQRVLRAFFPVAIIALLWGVALDAFVPTDFSLVVSGLAWLLHAAFIIPVAGPAYVIYFIYAYPTDA